MNYDFDNWQLLFPWLCDVAHVFAHEDEGVLGGHVV
jgi:hypothetical protein